MFCAGFDAMIDAVVLLLWVCCCDLIVEEGERLNSTVSVIMSLTLLPFENEG